MDEFTDAQIKPAAVDNSLLQPTSLVPTCPHCCPIYNLQLPKMQDFALTSYQGSTRISEFYLVISKCWFFRNFRGEIYYKSNIFPPSWYYQLPEQNRILLCEKAALELDQTYGRFLPPLVDTTYNWMHRGYVKWTYTNGGCVVSFSPDEYHKLSTDQGSRMSTNSHLFISSPIGFSASGQVPDINLMGSSQHQRANRPPVHKYSTSGGQSDIDLAQLIPVPKADVPASISKLPLAIISLQQCHTVANATTSEKSAKPVKVNEYLQEKIQERVQIPILASHPLDANTHFQGTKSTKSAKIFTTSVQKHKALQNTAGIEEGTKFLGPLSSKETAGPCLKNYKGQENVLQKKADSKTQRGSEQKTEFLGVHIRKNTKMNSKLADNTLTSKELLTLDPNCSSEENNNSHLNAAFIRKFDVSKLNVFAQPTKTKSETEISGDSSEIDISKVQLLSLNPKSESEPKSENGGRNSNRELDISKVDILPLAPSSKSENNDIRNSNDLVNTELATSRKKKEKKQKVKVFLPLSPKRNSHNVEKPSAISDAVMGNEELQNTPTSTNRTRSIISMDFPGTSRHSYSTNKDINGPKTPTEAQQPKSKDISGAKSLWEIPDHQPEDTFEYVCETCKLKHHFHLPSSDDVATTDSLESSRLDCFYYNNLNRLWCFQNVRREAFIRTLRGPPTWYFKPPLCTQQKLCVHYGSVLEDVYERFIQAFSNSQTMEHFPEYQGFFTTEAKPGTQFSELLHDVQKQMELGSDSGIASPSVTHKDAEVQVEIHLVNEDDLRETTPTKPKEQKPREDQVERYLLKEGEDPETSLNNTESNQSSNDVRVSCADVNPSHINSCLITTSEDEMVNLPSILSSLEFLSFNPVEKTFYYSRNTRRRGGDKAA